ncbi:hypothetical protein FACS189420_2860 [Bacteroidia bacterium]|nr:hypothetical protein FACS189420_2860 [Bacteroidia bacterium]
MIKKLRIYALLWLIVFCRPPSSAQNTVVSDYLTRTGEYAGIYNGQIKTSYNPSFYDNNPFHKSPDFADAEIVYKGLSYPGQKAVLDLYEEQLILLSPQKHYGIIVDPGKVDKVFFKDETFIWLDKSNISKGFYRLLSEEKQLKLVFKERFILNTTKILRHFDRETRYYLYYKERYYTVKNKKSFTNLFPQYKKQINAFAKEQKLDFKNNADRCLTLLADYCDTLLTSNNNP